MSDERTHQFGGEEFALENEFRGGGGEFGAENEAREGEEFGEERISSNGKRIKTLSIDRLSGLPEPLLIHILSFLGVKQAAITSVLSKRWQFLWAEVPRLEFLEWGIKSERMPQFVAWVHRILAIRSGNYLEKFNLRIKYDDSLASDVDAWVEFAVKSKVKEIALWMSSEEDFYILPEMFYPNSTLTKLSMSGCILDSERTIEWKNLTSLVLEDVELPQLLIEKIISGCPVLSLLNLSRCWGFNCLKVDSPILHTLRVNDSDVEENGPLLEISAPYAHFLDIRLNPDERKLRLTNISSVVTASIDLSGFDWIADDASVDVKGNAKELLEKTRHVKELELGHNLFEVLSFMVEDGWQIPQSRRVTLSVTAFPDDEHNMSGMISLLESSPDLETLVVDGFQLSGEDSLVWQPPGRDDLNRDLLHLKTVKIINFAEPSLGGDPMLMLARILLKRAPVLEKMLLCTDVEDGSVFVRMGRTLLTYPRSSPKAVVQIPY